MSPKNFLDNVAERGNTASTTHFVALYEYLSQSPLGFADGLAARLDFASGCVAPIADEFRGAHTAGPIAALDAAIESGKFTAARTILFVTVGAGIVVGLALYTK